MSIERKLLIVDAKELSSDNSVLDWPSSLNIASSNSYERLYFRDSVRILLGGLSIPQRGIAYSDGEVG